MACCMPGRMGDPADLGHDNDVCEFGLSARRAFHVSTTTDSFRCVVHFYAPLDLQRF